MTDRFEESFSNLAYAYLQEKSLKLIPYLIGFEVVEKDELGTRGLGVLAFKIGTQYLYAPVFFLNGELKPLELLYLRSKDLFLPLDDEWVDYLLKNRPLSLGEGVNEKSVRPSLSSNLDLYATPPLTGKHVTASWVGEASRDKVQDLQKSASYRALHFLEESPSNLRTAFLKAAKDNPKFLEKLVTFYGWERVKAATADFAPRYRQASYYEKPCASCKHLAGTNYCTKYTAAVSKGMTCDSWESTEKSASVKIVTGTSDPDLIKRLDPSQRETVLAGGVAYIMDKKAQAEEAVLYHTQYAEDFQNPNTTGVYSVLDFNGEFTKALVLLKPQGTALHGESEATVIELASGRFVCAPTSKIWVKKRIGEDGASAFNQYDDVVANLTPLPVKEGRPGMYYVLLNRNLNSSAPFEVLQTRVSAEGLTSYVIRFVEGEKSYATDAVRTRVSRNTGVSTDISSRAEARVGESRLSTSCSLTAEPIRVVISPKIAGGNERIYVVGDELVVPGSFELVPLTKPDCTCESVPAFGLGSDGALQESIKKHLKLASLRVVSPDGLFFTVNYGNIQARSLQKEAAVSLLVENYRLNPDLAYNIVLKAESQPRKPVDFLAKQAQLSPSFPIGMLDPRMISDISIAPGGRQQLNERLIPLNTQYPEPRGLSHLDNLYTGQIGHPGAPPLPPYLGPGMDIGLAMEVARQGDQQVFDHALLGILANSSGVGELLQRYIPDLEKALDKLGRLLFLYWWHHDEFEKLFGLVKLTELEERVRLVFKELGKLTLDLKRKERVQLSEF